MSGNCSARALLSDSFPDLLEFYFYIHIWRLKRLEWRLKSNTMEISEILFLQSSFFSKTITHYLRISGLWSLSSQFSNTIGLCLVYPPFSPVQNMPSSQKPSWLQGSPRFFLIFQASESSIANWKQFLICFFSFLIV